MVSETLARVEGPNLTLRLIRPEDADYVHGLRTHPAYNHHLSEVRGTAEDQRRWIEAYKAREAALRELYYVIERKDGTRCGVVRLYGIATASFTWGSWILDHNKTPKAALESAVLIYRIGFDALGLEKAVFDVRLDNDVTLAFHRRFGATEIRRDDRDIYFVYPRDRFAADRAGYLDILEGEREG
jgi:RimJ/RimL family protein N-acetyltransferase